MNIKCINVFFLFALCCETRATEYRYTSYSVPDTFEDGKAAIIIDTLNNRIQSSDVIRNLSVCNIGSEFLCLDSEWLKFYFPKNGKVSAPSNWRVGRTSFRLVRRDVIKILGLSKSVSVIEAFSIDRADHLQVFYFSDEDGLLAIKDIDRNRVQFFIVEGDRGFPK